MSSRHHGRCAAFAVALGVLFLAHGEARADDGTSDKLFYEGKVLMNEGKIAEACDLFRRSNALASGAGVLASWADCLEKLGRTATAWDLFHQAAAAARKSGPAEYVVSAERRAAELEPRLSRLVLRIAMRVDGLTVSWNGKRFPDETLGTKIPVNPGAYAIKALAPGYRAWSTSVTVAGEGAVVEVTVPALQKIATLTRPLGAREGPNLLAYVLGGTGLVLTGVGATFGAIALGNNGDVKRLCPNRRDCSTPAVDAANDRDRNAWIANIGIGLGLVGIGTAVVLWLAGGTTSEEIRARADTRRFSLSIDAAVERQGLCVTAVF